MIQMGVLLDEAGSAQAIERALERCPGPVGERVGSRIEAAGSANAMEWEELADDADALASALEVVGPVSESNAEAVVSLMTSERRCGLLRMADRP